MNFNLFIEGWIQNWYVPRLPEVLHYMIQKVDLHCLLYYYTRKRKQVHDLSFTITHFHTKEFQIFASLSLTSTTRYISAPQCTVNLKNFTHLSILCNSSHSIEEPIHNRKKDVNNTIVFSFLDLLSPTIQKNPLKLSWRILMLNVRLKSWQWRLLFHYRKYWVYGLQSSCSHRTQWHSSINSSPWMAMIGVSSQVCKAAFFTDLFIYQNESCDAPAIQMYYIRLLSPLSEKPVSGP